MSLKKIFLTLILIFGISTLLFSQENLDSLLNNELAGRTDYETATFKATRIITGQSVERMQKGDLDFRISHRFGKVNSGAYEFFGLDYSSIHFGLEYGLTNWMMIGVGRATYNKSFNGFWKFSLLRQCTGKRNIPVSISYFSAVYLNSVKWADTSRTNYFSSRLSYGHQLLIARKFNRRLSLQATPTFLHRNLVSHSTESNDVYAMGIGGRFKFTNRTALTFEYYYIINRDKLGIPEKHNPLSIGLDIETGGHVFQIHLTNSAGILENAYIADNTGLWKEGDIHLGFNISRVFTLDKKKH
jgi:hypothetical protein